ncbi:MAG: alkaline shock response membrane anchor protein AmaP [Actinomycetota bacterium]|nr:alkaline shock response membrane anchor protein AmaP [Actinomycetota bacterium]
MRVANRALAAAVALALLVGGLLVAAEIVVAGFGAEPWLLPHDQWYRSGVDNAWSSPASRWFFVALTAAGVALLALQVARRRPEALPLRPDQPAAAVEVSRRSLERSLERAAGRVDGVASAKARVSPSRAHLSAKTDSLAGPDLEAGVAEAARKQLRALGLPEPQITVSVRNRRRS